jgi:hypothetical protein
MSVEEHDRAVLTRDLPQDGFVAGDVGTVVHVYRSGAAYEVEFFSLDGETLDVVTVPAEALRPAGAHEVLHSRTP